MAADLSTVVAPTADRVGDVVGIQFADEEELALFIPCSGDVLLCTVAQWHRLKNVPVMNRADVLTAPWEGDGVEDSSPSSDLRNTLSNLGALLA